MRRFLIVLLLAACTKHNPSASCVDGVCSDPTFSFCDKDGVIGGDPNSCIQVTCNPGDFGACDGSDVLTCNAQGNGFDQNACDTGCSADTNGCNGCTPSKVECVGPKLQTCGTDGKVASTELCVAGCVDGAAPHCAYLEPRYLPDICDAPATAPSLDVTSSGTFDVDLDANCNGGVSAQTGGSSICVVRYDSIKVEAGAVLSVISTANQQGSASGRVIAFVADSELTIAGTVDASAVTDNTSNVAVNGPGGGVTLSGSAPADLNGGGGAGFKTPGGAGGGSAADGGAANGGASVSDPALLPVMTGGPAATNGGGGGGALMLVACRGTVSVSGTVEANGGGGQGGRAIAGVMGMPGKPGGGRGGGAGGYIVLQGLQLSITGSVFANGGAGGSGGPASLATGSSGQDGQPSDTSAAVGGTDGSAGAGGGGGLQGAATKAPGIGLKAAQPTFLCPCEGGGGGSVGFVQAYTPTGISPVITPAHVSPPFQPSATTPTR